MRAHTHTPIRIHTYMHTFRFFNFKFSRWKVDMKFNYKSFATTDITPDSSNGDVGDDFYHRYKVQIIL